MSTKPLERVKALVAAVRGDGWSNTLTGLGTVARDKVMSSTFLRNRILTDEELASLYEDDMGARIVDRVVEDSLRKGVLFKVKDDDFNKSRELEGSLIGAFDGLEVIEAVSDADCWGRLFGGGAVMVNTDDPGAAEEPLILESVRSVRSLMTLDKRDIWPHSWDADPGSRTFGKPLLYQIASVQMPGGKTSYNAVRLVHASRLIVFEGKRTPMRKRLENNGWSLSVLQPVHDVLRQFGVTWQSASHLMGDAAQGVWKMKGLIDMLASGQKDVVQERMRVADMSRSVARAVLIDADDEEFERKEIAMTGYSTMLEKFMVRLAAAADMPVTKLMGQSPAGLNATGRE
jgi:phage-related protein (TIGR01555 family)